MTAKSILDILGLLFLFICGIQILATVRAYGSLSTRAVIITIRTTLKSSKILLLLAGITTLLSAIFQPFFPSWIPPFPPLLQVGGGLIGLNAACLPPIVLYLAASKPEGILLANDLSFAIAPLKLTHLLESFYSEAPLAEREQIHESEYRVSGNWQKTVMDLCDIVPLIIIDARFVTGPVVTEINHILDSGHERRTFFVADQYGNAPALSHVSRSQRGKLHISTAAELIFSLRRVGFKTLVSGPGALCPAIRKKLEARGALL